MPRDLSTMANEITLSSMPTITKSPEPLDADNDDDETPHVTDKRDSLHPYTQTLSLSNIDSCVLLENAAFPRHEAASREKFQYRLKLCSELSMGIFTSQTDSTILTAESSVPVYSGAPERKSVLLGHIIATKTTNSIVTDNDMAIPALVDHDYKLGHKEEGRTVCLHSLAVLPDFQKFGLGSALTRAYIQRLQSQDVADRIALIAHDYLVPYYEQFGFVNNGKSEAQFGGGGWYDMVLHLKDADSA